MAFFAGDEPTAAQLNALTPTPVVGDAQATAGTSTSTTYTATLTGGVTCGVVFTAPASGTIVVHNSCDSFTSATAFIYCSFEVREGVTIGSGTVVDAADDATALKHQTNFQTFGMTRSTRVSGLTPGAQYNVRQMFRVQSGTGTWLNKDLIAQPTT